MFFFFLKKNQFFIQTRFFFIQIYVLLCNVILSNYVKDRDRQIEGKIEGFFGQNRGQIEGIFGGNRGHFVKFILDLSSSEAWSLVSLSHELLYFTLLHYIITRKSKI